jgi:hypothetical protein
MMSFGANCALSQQKTGGPSNLTSQISRAGLLLSSENVTLIVL